MHDHPLERWRHRHDFLGADHLHNERRTRLVIALTLAMMLAEVAGGMLFGSMALLADGWHMATHAGALSLSAAAYAFARRHAKSSRYVFGTGKVGDLAGFTSAVLLAAIACLIGYESVQHLLDAPAIRFDEAILVAVLGLAVNLASALILGSGGARAHEHGHGAGHAHSDHNLRSAHLHVLADALTSVFAIVALLAGKYLGWSWTDPVCGLVGALVILRWSYGLARDAGAVLLDTESDPELAERIRARLEDEGGDRVTDLHVWRVGPGRFAAMASIVSDDARAPEDYKKRLANLACLVHVTIEVNPCPGDHPLVAEGAPRT